MLKELPSNCAKVLERINKWTGAPKFILFGGAALDLLLGKKRGSSDYDIGIQASKITIHKLKTNLQRVGFSVYPVLRKYVINYTHQVTLMCAKRDDTILDVALMDELLDQKFELVGNKFLAPAMDKFNVDSVYWRYPEMDFADKYDAVNAIKDKCLIAVNGLFTEDPVLLVNRILYLGAKYEVPIASANHSHSIQILLKRIDADARTGVVDPAKRIDHISAILKSILVSRTRWAYITEVLKTSVLGKTCPVLDAALRRVLCSGRIRVEQLTNKIELARLIKRCGQTASDREILEREFRNMFRARNWDSWSVHCGVKG